MFSGQVGLLAYKDCNTLQMNFAQITLATWSHEYGQFIRVLDHVDEVSSLRCDQKLEVLLEQYRLELIQRLNEILEGELLNENTQVDRAVSELNVEKTPNLWDRVKSKFVAAWEKIKDNQVIMHIGFFVFSIVGLLVECMDNFLGFHASIATLLQSATNPVVLPLALGMTALGAVLFITFEMQMLQTLFGVDVFVNREQTLIETKTQQLKQIKHALQSVQSLEGCPIKADLLLEHAKQVAQQAKPYKESTGRAWLRRLMLGLGAITMVSYGYFVGSSMISALVGTGAVAAGFAVTGPGVLLVAGVMLSFFVLFAAMQAKSIDKRMNPLRKPMALLNGAVESIQKGLVRAGMGMYALFLQSKAPLKHGLLDSPTKQTSQLRFFGSSIQQEVVAEEEKDRVSVKSMEARIS